MALKFCPVVNVVSGNSSKNSILSYTFAAYFPFIFVPLNFVTLPSFTSIIPSSNPFPLYFTCICFPFSFPSTIFIIDLPPSSILYVPLGFSLVFVTLFAIASSTAFIYIFTLCS